MLIVSYERECLLLLVLCVFSDSSLSWSYNGNMLSNTASYSIRDSGTTLIVLAAVSSQSGEYSCAIDSAYSVSAHLTVLG